MRVLDETNAGGTQRYRTRKWNDDGRGYQEGNLSYKSFLPRNLKEGTVTSESWGGTHTDTGPNPVGDFGFGVAEGTTQVTIPTIAARISLGTLDAEEEAP